MPKGGWLQNAPSGRTLTAREPRYPATFFVPNIQQLVCIEAQDGVTAAQRQRVSYWGGGGHGGWTDQQLGGHLSVAHRLHRAPLLPLALLRQLVALCGRRTGSLVRLRPLVPCRGEIWRVTPNANVLRTGGGWEVVGGEKRMEGRGRRTVEMDGGAFGKTETERGAVGRRGSGDGREWAGHTRERMFFLAIAAAPKGSVGRMGRRTAPPPGTRPPSNPKQQRRGLRSEEGDTQPRGVLVSRGRGERWRLYANGLPSPPSPPPLNQV